MPTVTPLTEEQLRARKIAGARAAYCNVLDRDPEACIHCGEIRGTTPRDVAKALIRCQVLRADSIHDIVTSGYGWGSWLNERAFHVCVRSHQVVVWHFDGAPADHRFRLEQLVTEIQQEQRQSALQLTQASLWDA